MTKVELAKVKIMAGAACGLALRQTSQTEDMTMGEPAQRFWLEDGNTVVDYGSTRDYGRITVRKYHLETERQALALFDLLTAYHKRCGDPDNWEL